MADALKTEWSHFVLTFVHKHKLYCLHLWLNTILTLGTYSTIIAQGSQHANDHIRTWESQPARLSELDQRALTLQSVRADIHRLRLGYPGLSELEEDPAIQYCSYCEAATAAPLLHYLLHCPTTAAIRRTNVYYIYEHDPSAFTSAADLVAATPLPRKLLQLVKTIPPPR